MGLGMCEDFNTHVCFLLGQNHIPVNIGGCWLRDAPKDYLFKGPRLWGGKDGWLLTCKVRRNTEVSGGQAPERYKSRMWSSQWRSDHTVVIPSWDATNCAPDDQPGADGRQDMRQLCQACWCAHQGPCTAPAGGKGLEPKSYVQMETEAVHISPVVSFLKCRL